jgi:O-antigen ligase
MLAVARAAANRPAAVAALAVLLVCVPAGDRDMSASFHVAPADVGSVLLVASVLPRLRAGAGLFRGWPAVVLVAAVLGFGVATLASPEPAASAVGFVRYVQLFVVVPAAVALALRERRDVWLVCWAVLIAAGFEAVVGVQQYVTGTGASFEGQDVRAVGTFGAVDIMGLSTVVGYGLIVAFGLGLALRGRARFGLFACAALLVVPLLLSLSRGAVVATCGAIAAMMLAAVPRLTLRVLVFGAAVAVLVGAMVPATTAIGARFATIGTSLTDPDRSVSDRYELWQTATGMWGDHPVVGVGPKLFPAYRDSYAPLHLSSSSDIADPSLGFRHQPLMSPHNMYLLVLSEQGMAGGLAFGGLLLAVAVGAWRRTRQAAAPAALLSGQLPDGRFAGVAALGAVAWTLLSFLFGDFGGPTSVLMSVLIGLGLWWALQPAPDRSLEAAR